MLIRKPLDIGSSEITPRSTYLRRREFLGTLAGLGLGSAAAFADTLATTITSRRVNRLLVVECLRRSMSSLIWASFSINVSVRGT